MKKKSFLFFLFIIIIIFATVFAYYKYELTAKTNSDNAIVYNLKIVNGSSVKGVAKTLEENSIIRCSFVMYLFARKENVVIKSGRYTINSAMSVPEIATFLQSGKQTSVSVAIPEGLTYSKIAKTLEKKEITSAESFINECQNPEILKKYNIPAENLEGYLFPDTYFLDYEMPAEKVVKIMVDNFFDKIKDVKKLETLSPEELHQKIVLASIVEREYRVEKEAPLIASVFVNRLRRGIGLYSCATIEYIITEIQHRDHPDVITYEDLRIDSPYNTYKWAGLPPGAISNPGLVALRAAANPPKTSYYFFRLVDANLGTHHFSTNFDDHTETGRSMTTKRAAGQ